MKRIRTLIFLLLILGAAPHAKAQEWALQWMGDGKGRETFVFGDTVFLRTGPGTKHAVTDTLFAGELVKILETDTALFKLKGIEAYWVKVAYLENGAKKEGYLWSGLLALEPMRRGNTKFIYGIERIQARDTVLYEEKIPVKTYLIKLLVKRNDSILALQRIRVDGESMAYTEASVSGPKGLKNIQHIISFSFSGEACGVPSYTYNFAWNGTKLIELPLQTHIADADVYYYGEELVFPAEKGGAPDKIVMNIRTEESTEKLDKKGNTIFKTEKKKKYFQWDGERLRPSSS